MQKQENWKKAVNDEIRSIEETDTWMLGELPEDTRDRNSKSVFTKKIYAKRRDIRYREIRVAKCFTQRKGNVYDSVFSPVSKFSSLGFMLVMNFQEDLKFIQLDLKLCLH